MATTALALIGLFNVFGTYIAGSLGQRMSKPRILSAIYLLRSVVIVVFLSAPLTPWSVYLFAAAMGLLWLSTVPPTNAVVAQIFGVQYMSMLGGFVFLNHQLGSFLGAWLGGKLYESTGSYDIVWWIAVGLGVFAAAGQLAGARNPDRAARAAAGVMQRGLRLGLALLARGGAGGGVPELPESAPGGGPGQSCLGLLLTHACGAGGALALGVPLGAADPPRRARARPGLRQRPPRALAGGTGLRRHRRRPRRGRAGSRCAPSPRCSWPTWKARPGRCRASASMPWSSPTTCGGRLWPELLAALADGGVLIYETFADGNQSVGKPSRADFLLRHGELLEVARGLRIVAYEDGFLEPPPRYVQRIAAVADCRRRPALPALGRACRGRVKSADCKELRMNPIVGSIVALVTPMHEDGSVDYAALRRLIDWHIAEGTDCIGVVGTTGESPTVSMEENCEIIRVAVEQAAGRVPIMAGTGANATSEAIELTRYAKKVGADCHLSVVPYYNRPSQEGIYQHFRAVAEAVDLPMVLYNVPGRTVADMQHDTVVRLAQVDGIVGLKDATGDIARAAWLIKRLPKSFSLYSGDDGTAVALMLLGGRGNVSVTANVAPQADARAVHGGHRRPGAPRHARSTCGCCRCTATCSANPARHRPSGPWRNWACAAPRCACRSRR